MVDGPQAAALRERGHRVVAEPDETPAVMLAFGSAAADAIAFAQRHPDRCLALVLFDPATVADDLAAVAQPALIVGRPGDPEHPIEVAEACWRGIPTSRLIVETPGDVPLWDRPHDLAVRVDRFLAEMEVR